MRNTLGSVKRPIYYRETEDIDARIPKIHTTGRIDSRLVYAAMCSNQPSDALDKAWKKQGLAFCGGAFAVMRCHPWGQLPKIASYLREAAWGDGMRASIYRSENYLFVFLAFLPADSLASALAARLPAYVGSVFAQAQAHFSPDTRLVCGLGYPFYDFAQAQGSCFDAFVNAAMTTKNQPLICSDSYLTPATPATPATPTAHTAHTTLAAPTAYAPHTAPGACATPALPPQQTTPGAPATRQAQGYPAGAPPTPTASAPEAPATSPAQGYPCATPTQSTVEGQAARMLLEPWALGEELCVRALFRFWSFLKPDMPTLRSGAGRFLEIYLQMTSPDTCATPLHATALGLVQISLRDCLTPTQLSARCTDIVRLLSHSEGLTESIPTDVNDADAPPTASDDAQSLRANGLLRHARVADYIRHHVSEDVTLSQAAAVAGYSPTYFSKYFHKAFGMNFSDYLNYSRIEAAKAYLADERLSIKDAARQVGIPNPAYFSSIFKKITGVTPSHYRASVL
ncbi:MAG: helix-turn-helix domain-containing protein [Lachnospiraceae bacterium]|nr:helix-turn-helix domain-containing protein [Lachnospiraceae bacterium]